jgi:hypothetical protein
LGLPLKALEAKLRGASGDPDEARRALATALALAWLESRAADSRDEWTLLAAKAERWLRKAVARPQASGGWRETAVAVLQA